MALTVVEYVREDGSNPPRQEDPIARSPVDADGDALIVLLGGRDEEISTERHRAGEGDARRIQGAQGCPRRSQTQEVSEMALTREFKMTVAERVRRDPAFAKALLDEAATVFLNGKPDLARLILRDLVNATVGFEGLATETGKPSKSLHRMLSKQGNPSMDNLAAIITVLRKRLGVDLQAHAVRAA
jgi:DNA-binding phage protein